MQSQGGVVKFEILSDITHFKPDFFCHTSAVTTVRLPDLAPGCPTLGQEINFRQP